MMSEVAETSSVLPADVIAYARASGVEQFLLGDHLLAMLDEIEEPRTYISAQHGSILQAIRR